MNTFHVVRHNKFAFVFPLETGTSKVTTDTCALVNWIFEVKFFDYDSGSKIKVFLDDVVQLRVGVGA